MFLHKSVSLFHQADQVHLSTHPIHPSHPLRSLNRTDSLRSEAFYEANEECPENRQVKATKSTGLRNCKIFSDKTPDDALSFLGILGT